MKYTLEQLQAMSDDDLSRTVTELTAFLDIIDCGELGEYDVYQWIEMHGISIDINNNLDMVPIIDEYHIVLSKASSDDYWCASATNTPLVIDENPLRAAAIVYVLVKQVHGI